MADGALGEQVEGVDVGVGGELLELAAELDLVAVGLEVGVADHLVDVEYNHGLRLFGHIAEKFAGVAARRAGREAQQQGHHRGQSQ